MAIIKKAMAAVTIAEFAAVSKKWQAEYVAPAGFEISADERAWLDNHPIIKVAAETSFAPYEFVNGQEQIDGMTGDYLKRLETLLGVRFAWSGNKNFVKGVEQVKDGGADLITGIARIPGRFEFLLYTEPFVPVSAVIFARKGSLQFNNMAALKGKRISLVKGFALISMIRKDHPEIKIIEMPTIEAALKLVATGKVDAYVDTIASTTYQLGRAGITNIAVVGDTEYHGGLGMAVSARQPVFAGLLNRALKEIDEEARNEISRNWMTVTLQKKTDYKTIIYAALLVLVVLAALLVWGWTLKREINRRRALEGKLIEAREAADDANHAKSEFLANLNHELRTPLNAIIGFSDVIEKRLFGSIDNSKYEDYLGHINTSGKHLAALVHDVLDLSKIESGRQELTDEVLDVKDEIDFVTEMLAGHAADKNLTVIAKCPEAPTRLRADRTALRQSLTNLMSNAIKFSPPGERIICRLDVLDDHRIEIAIADNGIGMNKEEVIHVLKPFAQVEAAQSSDTEGTGLGLPITMGLMQNQDGDLTIDSQPGGGTTVALVFPAWRNVS